MTKSKIELAKFTSSLNSKFTPRCDFKASSMSVRDERKKEGKVIDLMLSK